jgi:hypothetical protein
MVSREELEKTYEQEKAKVAEYVKNPESPAAKKTARMAGVLMLVVGLLFAGANYYMYAYQGSVYILLAALALGFVGLGLYAIVFGKMPKPKR